LSRKTPIPEDALVALLKQRNQQGYSLLYDNYARALYGVILKIVKSQELAADVLQEAFVKIWKNIDSYDKKKGSLFTWMLNIARNLAIDKTRSQQYRQGLKNQPLENFVGLVEIPGDAYLETETKTDLIGIDKILSSLRPDYQVLINLLYFQGFTQAEAAKELDIPLGTVKTRIKAALDQVREMVGKQ
jgi:RNA polymerase sigma-70 factor (ECF subfamily)